jgi:transcription-repair coupling factor (superfamily II helicase)
VAINPIDFYLKHPIVTELQGLLKTGNKEIYGLKGLAGSSKSLAIAATLKNINTISLVIMNDRDEAAYINDDLARFIGEEQVLFFPSSYKRSVQYQQTDSNNLILRTKVLDSLNVKEVIDGGNSKSHIIVTYPEALIEKVVSLSILKKNTLYLKVGEKITIDFVKEILHEYGFERVDFVYEPGQFSTRGSILDIFSFSGENPYRIDFFGDDVDSIRTFDIESQLSKVKLNEITIVPNIQGNIGQKASSIEVTKRETFFDFLPKKSILWVSNPKYIAERINEIYENTNLKAIEGEATAPIKEELLVTGTSLLQSMKTFTIIELGQQQALEHKADLVFNTSPQPPFNKNFDILGDTLNEFTLKGYICYILSENEKQFERLDSIFKETKKEVNFNPMQTIIHEGFTDHDLRICLFTDHEIFERFHKYKINEKFGSHNTITLQELSGLHPGDYVVHIDHGIGVFGGLQKIEVNGKMQEAVRLVYRDSDILYVNINSLHKISKYSGKEGAEPKIYKLGSGAWQKLKQTTKSRVKDIAKDLIALYAKRRSQKGFQFNADTYLQHELEASFIYEDTPDQFTATKATKQDMESEIPMDRLVCGDVGFGKTEVAIRSAFKAVADNKQVAVLVPTTILALQHYTTFKERLRNFPCTVDFISRMKKPKEQKETLGKLEEGKIDIIIGTHRLFSKQVKFKDLGLLIIDEEQKFGVGMKEKLRHLKVNVDTLTLTATPIPRTLQFSLLGARDLSIINTPPPNRHPIITELHSFNKDIIREGINYEVSRGGQIYFIHNRIQNIYEVEVLIKKLCPDVKTLVAHGQMEGEKLEKIMLDFIAGDYDVLIATTIVESGLDIPNANTIYINDAQNFGLSDLHQLRGRVGRSNKKAFCYLLGAPWQTLTPEARRRLKAIEEFSELGSGFNIAMQDLDIRGAGNLLGAEQSGFISDIGYETYQKILNEAIQELKEGEYKDLYAEERKQKEENKVAFISECMIDADCEMLIPDNYVENVTERIKLYRELDNIPDETKLQAFSNQLIDRFGPMPAPTLELLNVVRLRWLSLNLGIEKIILKNNKMVVYFIANQMSPYYQSATFSKILANVQKNPKLYAMKESKDKLSMSLENIPDITEAINALKKLE